MTNIWADTYKTIRDPYFQIEDPYTLNEKKEKEKKKEKEESDEKEKSDEKEDNGKPKRWWDDDGDGKGWEKGEVSGSFKGKKKSVKEERELHSKKEKTEKLDARNGIKNKIQINPSIEEQVELWIDELVAEGHDISEFTFDEMVEIYESADAEQLDEISQKTATRAYAASSTGEFEGQDSPRDVKRTDNLRRQIKRKFGDKAAQHADRAAHAMTFGRKSKFVKMPPKPTKEEFELDEADTSAMPPKGDAVTTKADPIASAKKRAAQAQVRKERADVQLAMARSSAKQGPNESVVQYLSGRSSLFEAVFDPKKSKMRPASERSSRSITDQQRKSTEKEKQRTAEIHSKGETVLAGLRSSGKTGKVKTSPDPKPSAPEANRKVKGREDKLASAADKVLKSLRNK